MFFTQDDYKKIQQWLIKNSVKDTEFNEANIPFNGEEIITIVQDNHNKKVFLKDLIAQVFNLGISDFVNVTDKYDAPNISLEKAIRLIPSRARKEGQVITFLDEENHWYIYQFKGALNQWNILDQWKDLFESIYIKSILPDEEDLTKSLPDENGNSYLSFKNKRHNKLDFSGLGKVYLRKNIINGVNTLLQKDISRDNTIYIIQYDYDLNGTTIEIPDGCVLEFQGGSLSNGELVGVDTKVIGAWNSLNLSRVILPQFSTSWGEVKLSEVKAKHINIDTECNINYLWQLSANQKISLNHDINIINGGAISLNIGCEINGNWNNINVKDAESMHNNIITVDGDILTDTYKGVYGDRSFNSRTRIVLNNLNVRMDDSLAYLNAIKNNTSSAILITASDENWVWGVTLNNISVSGHFMSAVRVKPNGKSWIHDIYINHLINDRTLYRLLIDSDDEQIQNSGVAVYDSNGSMQADGYSYVVWPYMPPRLVKMYTGMVMVSNVFPWDWHLTKDENGNNADGSDVHTDYIYEGHGGVLHVEDSYYTENEKNSLYNWKYNYITGSNSFLELSTIKSNRSLTHSLTKRQENLLLERKVDNLSNTRPDWVGMYKYSKLSFMLPYGITYNTTISYPRFVEIGYFTNMSTSEFCLTLEAEGSKLVFDGAVYTYLNYKTREASGFLHSLSWCYFKDDAGYHFGFILANKSINLSAITFTIEKSQSFCFNLTSHVATNLNLESLYFTLMKQQDSRPEYVAVGDVYFDTELGKPIWAKETSVYALLNFEATSVNTKDGTIVLEINSKTYEIQLPSVYSTIKEVVGVIAKHLVSYGFKTYIHSDNFYIFHVDGVSPTFSITSNDTGANVSLGLNRAYSAPKWVDASGEQV